MTKDEALDLALKALRFARDDGYENEVSQEAITAIKQARSAPVQEPVAWMNPHGGFLSASYIDKFASGLDKEIHNIPLYTTPPAQPAPVQPVAWAIYQRGRLQSFWLDKGDAYDFEFTTEHQWQPLYTTPPAAQRQWVGLTDEEIEDCYGGKVNDFARAIEAKLKEKNNDSM